MKRKKLAKYTMISLKKTRAQQMPQGTPNLENNEYIFPYLIIYSSSFPLLQQNSRQYHTMPLVLGKYTFSPLKINYKT